MSETITLPRKVVQEALEALCNAGSRLSRVADKIDCAASAEALRAALAKPTAEESSIVEEALRRENERLREALVRFGRHQKECDAYRGCVCGLDAALQGETAIWAARHDPRE